MLAGIKNGLGQLGKNATVDQEYVIQDTHTHRVRKSHGNLIKQFILNPADPQLGMLTGTGF